MSSTVSDGSAVRSKYFPSSLASAAMAALSTVDTQETGLGGAEVAAHSPRELRRQGGPFVGGGGVGVVDPGLEPFNKLAADRGVAFGLFGVVTGHEPVPCGAVVDPDFLDPHVVTDLVVAARSCQCCGGFGVPADLLADDVVPAASLEVPAVLSRGEPAVRNPDDMPEFPVGEVVFDLTDQGLVVGVPGPAPHPDRDPGPCDGRRQSCPGAISWKPVGLITRRPKFKSWPRQSKTLVEGPPREKGAAPAHPGSAETVAAGGCFTDEAAPWCTLLKSVAPNLSGLPERDCRVPGGHRPVVNLSSRVRGRIVRSADRSDLSAHRGSMRSAR